MAFAGKHVRKDVIRAAHVQANDPSVAGGLDATAVHDEAIEVPDTATRWAETLEDKRARALALGQRRTAAAYYRYSAVRAERTPEDEYGSREAFDAMKRAVAGAEPLAPQLFDLLFEHGLTWKEAADTLGVDERQAYRIGERTFAMLRAMLGDRKPPAG
jgi:DNA-directed RNA polymerase specialized sigma24 family protein